MAKSVRLEVITPSKLFYKGDIELVITRTLTGDDGFMAGHSWAVKLLDVGELWIQEAGQKDFKVAAISGGFIDVKDDIIIYTDAAEWSADIDMDRVRSERESAQAFLDAHAHIVGAPSSEITEEESINIAKAKIAIAKAQTRMNVAAGGARRKR